MKRSNRLVLLIGVFLAIIAFVGIILLQGGGGSRTDDPEVVTELPTVVAATDIPLGTRITAEQVRTQVLPLDARDPGAFQDTSQVIGKVVRQARETVLRLVGAAVALPHRGGGYVLHCDPAQVDLHAGRMLVERARALASVGSDARAAGPTTYSHESSSAKA